MGRQGQGVCERGRGQCHPQKEGSMLGADDVMMPAPSRVANAQSGGHQSGSHGICFLFLQADVLGPWSLRPIQGDFAPFGYSGALRCKSRQAVSLGQRLHLHFKVAQFSISPVSLVQSNQCRKDGNQDRACRGTLSHTDSSDGPSPRSGLCSWGRLGVLPGVLEGRSHKK